MKFAFWKAFLSSKGKPPNAQIDANDTPRRPSQLTLLAPTSIQATCHDLRISEEINERLRKDLAIDIEAIHQELPDSPCSTGSPESSIFAYPTKPV